MFHYTSLYEQLVPLFLEPLESLWIHAKERNDIDLFKASVLGSFQIFYISPLGGILKKQQQLSLNHTSCIRPTFTAERNSIHV